MPIITSMIFGYMLAVNESMKANLNLIMVKALSQREDLAKRRLSGRRILMDWNFVWNTLERATISHDAF